MDNKAKLLSVIASFPLFFSWLFVFTFSKHEQVKKHCLYSMINSAVFFTLVLFCAFLYFAIPFVGAFLASIFHAASIVIYFASSIFLVYSVVFSKNIEISFLSKIVDRLSFLFDKSTHSSAG